MKHHSPYINHILTIYWISISHPFSLVNHTFWGIPKKWNPPYPTKTSPNPPPPSPWQISFASSAFLRALRAALGSRGRSLDRAMDRWMAVRREQAVVPSDLPAESVSIFFPWSRDVRDNRYGGFHSHGDTPIAGWFIRIDIIFDYCGWWIATMVIT